MNEFKWIPWFEWYYDINKNWKIRSYWKRGNRWAILKDKPQTLINPRFKTDKKRKEKPVAAVTLYNWIRKQKFYVARLVAQLFMWYNPIDKTKQIIFRDWNWLNCKMDNLYIWTVSERALNSVRSFTKWYLLNDWKRKLWRSSEKSWWESWTTP